MRFVSTPLRRPQLEEAQDDSSGSCTPRIKPKDRRKGWFRVLTANRRTPHPSQPLSPSSSVELELSMGKCGSDAADAAGGNGGSSRSSSSRRLEREESQRRFPSQVLADAIASSWQRVDHRVEVFVSSLGPWGSNDSSKTPPLTPPPTSPLRPTAASSTQLRPEGSFPSSSKPESPSSAAPPAAEASPTSAFDQTAPPPQPPQLEDATATTTSPTATPQQELQPNATDGLITCLSTITDLSSDGASSERDTIRQAQAWQTAVQQPLGIQVFGATVPGTMGSQWVVAPDPRPAYPTHLPPREHTAPRVSFGPMVYDPPPHPPQHPYPSRQQQTHEPANGAWGGQRTSPSAQAYGESAFDSPPVPTTHYQQWRDGIQYSSRTEGGGDDDDDGPNRFRILQSASSSEFEWTPQDSAYGAAFPVCGWLPKPIRRAIEATIIAVGIMAFCFLLISISIRIASGDGNSGKHKKKNDEDEGGSSSSDDDDDAGGGNSGNNDRDDDDDDYDDDYNSGGPYYLDDDYYQVTVNDDDDDDYYSLDDDDVANDDQAGDDEANDDASDDAAGDDQADDDGAGDDQAGDDAAGDDDALGDDNAGDDDGGNRLLGRTPNFLHDWYEEHFNVHQRTTRALRRRQRRRRHWRREEVPLLQPRVPTIHVPPPGQPPEPLHTIRALPI